MRITVKNKLEIRPGNVIQVPGCEPTSSLTSTGLLKNVDCASSIISLEDALALIPNARVVRAFYPAGQNGTGLFFELPDGPPPDQNDCDCKTIDYYAILRENARPLEPEDTSLAKECASIINFSGCVTEQPNIFRIKRDPNQLPNAGNEPVGGPAQTVPLTVV